MFRILCKCTATSLVLENLNLPPNPEFERILRHMQFLEHVPRPQPLDNEFDDLREELRYSLFEEEPEAIYRIWLRMRVKNIGHNAQTPEERDFATIQEFDSLLVYGAFEELFCKDYGSKLPGILELLEEIGATDTHDLLQEAMDHLASPYPLKAVDRRRAWNRQASKKVKKNQWEKDLDTFYAEYLGLEERCIDVAAKRAFAGYIKRGMPVPPELPKRKRVQDY